MNKNIKELTELQAREILAYVHPNKTEFDNPHNYEYWFEGLAFEGEKKPGGGEYVTSGGRSIIGIKYRGGFSNDGYILHFNNTKVLLWLYRNGFDIEEFLDFNQHLSETEKDFDNFALGIEILSKGEESFRDSHKKNWTLEYVKDRCKELLNTYYYKDHK